MHDSLRVATKAFMTATGRKSYRSITQRELTGDPSRRCHSGEMEDLLIRKFYLSCLSQCGRVTDHGIIRNLTYVVLMVVRGRK